MSNSIKTFAIFGNTFQREKSVNIRQVLSGIAAIGGRIVIEHDFAEFLKAITDLSDISYTQCGAESVDADFAISIGGDGTFLKTAQLIGCREIPLIGINTGHLGFISDVLPQDASSFFGDVMQGNYQIEERSLLLAQTQGAELAGNPCALNEIAILKHDISSMISISTYVNDSYLATYQADGLVISTPTGSTGYSLSAGGPIISPDSKSIVLSPIAAHSLSVRPFILNDNVQIRLNVQSRSRNFLVAIDGRSESLSDTATILISKAPYSIKIVRPQGHSFFDTLRNKLLWGADKR